MTGTDLRQRRTDRNRPADEVLAGRRPARGPAVRRSGAAATEPALALPRPFDGDPAGVGNGGRGADTRRASRTPVAGATRTKSPRSRPFADKPS